VAAFKFRLASVLRFRERVKEEKQWELAALNATRQEIEDQVRALEQELVDTENRMAAEVGQLFSASELRLQGEYVGSLEHRLQKQRIALEQLDEKIVAKREELVEAMRGMKTLEQLRRRLEEKFRHEDDVEQQKFTDEVAQRKFTDPYKRKKLP
jgi:flagellar protein FliJ